MTTNKFLHAKNQSLWMYWFLFTIGGLIIVLFLFAIWLGSLLSTASPMLFGSVLGMSFGLVTSMAQWILLKKHFNCAYLWIPATTIAWMLFFALNMAGFFGRGYNLSSKIFEGWAHGFLFGAFLGCIQWFAISGFNTKLASWIWINALIWSFSAMVGDSCKMIFNLHGPTEFLIAFPIVALLSGISMDRLILFYRKRYH